jgi:pimeloyl-ACP methyl ester carboxylesterase
VATSLGFIGYQMTPEPEFPCHDDNKTPILCFHSSPRSSDEYVDLMPLLGKDGRKMVAMDVPGYGLSGNPLRSCSIDNVADAFLQVADTLQIDKFLVIGNLMGCFHGVSLASRYPDRVVGAVMSNLYYYPPGEMIDETATASTSDTTPTSSDTPADVTIPDPWELKEDGSHLIDLHNSRSKWLDPELNVRVVQGQLTYLVNRRARYAQGISIQALTAYDFPAAAKKVTCPTLCIKGEKCVAFFDMIGYHGTERFETGAKFFSDTETTSLSGDTSTLVMVNQDPDGFATICNDFLEKRGL